MTAKFRIFLSMRPSSIFAGFQSAKGAAELKTSRLPDDIFGHALFRTACALAAKTPTTAFIPFAILSDVTRLEAFLSFLPPP